MDLLAIAARVAAEVETGPGAGAMTWQADFPDTVPCQKCGAEARLAIGVREDAEDGCAFEAHGNDPDGDGFWLHDCAAFATYLCTDAGCASATTLWNQA